jgi:hypothetical protein
MARMNISVPDALYERLDRLRDRVNASRVCAVALEKELDTLEARPAIADPEIEQLIKRLQSTKERWYQRGQQDGRRWAIDTASRHELASVGTNLGDADGTELARLARGPEFNLPLPPPGAEPHVVPLPHPGVPVHGGPHIAYKQIATRGRPAPTRDVVFTKAVFPPSGVAPFPAFPQSFSLDQSLERWQKEDGAVPAEGRAEASGTAAGTVDEAAYLEGWRDAVVGIWRAVAPALR